MILGQKTPAPAPAKSESQIRKEHPIFSGVMNYFPDALWYISEISVRGNKKHNPGEPLHWSKDKSNDHADTVARHLLDAGKVDAEGQLHSGNLAWRALALLQTEIEERKKTGNWTSFVQPKLSNGE